MTEAEYIEHVKSLPLSVRIAIINEYVNMIYGKFAPAGLVEFWSKHGRP